MCRRKGTDCAAINRSRSSTFGSSEPMLTHTGPSAHHRCRGALVKSMTVYELRIDTETCTILRSAWHSCAVRWAQTTRRSPLKSRTY